jgi:hypothetical protein
MTLWQLLVAVCGAFATGSALAPAQLAHAGTAQYLSASILGLIIGIASAWTMNATAERLVKRIMRARSNSQKLYWRCLYIGTLPWMAISGYIAFQGSSALIRIIHSAK